MQVRDAMTQDVAVAPVASTVRDVAGIMRIEDCGFVPIADDGRLVGVVTDRDLAIRCLADDSLPGPVGDMPIAEVMTSSDLVTIGSDEQLRTAAHMMALRQVRRLVVTDDGVITGVITLGDLEQALHGRGAAAREAILAVTLQD
jgi:CBS domain-containing protein